MRIIEMIVGCDYKGCLANTTAKFLYEESDPDRKIHDDIENMMSARSKLTGRVRMIQLPPNWSFNLMAPEGSDRLIDLSFRCPKH